MGIRDRLRAATGRVAAAARRPATDRRTHRTLTLEPLHQWAMIAIDRYRAAAFRTLLTEIEANRPVTPADLVLALVRLEQEGLIAPPETATAQPGRRYRLTSAGRRVARVLPRPPRSAIDVYL